VNRCYLSGTLEDFTLGRAFLELNMTLVRSNRLHQFRAVDYPEDLLRFEDPVSFHKFEFIDPYDTYDTWFRAEDEDFRREAENGI
jgi:hypothetical protein